MAATAPTPLEYAQDELADVFGDIAAFWGFTKTQGRIYGLLFLTEHPQSHGDIHKRLGISAGSTSMTLSSLVQWGVLVRRGRLYEAETDMWKVITGVFRRRERDQINTAISRMSRIAEALEGAKQPDTATRFALKRVRELSEFFALGRRFLDAFVIGNPVRELLAVIATRAAKFSPLNLETAQHDASIGH